MHACSSCPKENGLKKYLAGLDVLNHVEEIKYKQWVSVDRCNLVEVTDSTEDLVNSCKSMAKLTRHHFTSKHTQCFS